MENTPNLDLPYIMPAQAQKHVTHNEALDLIDTLLQCAVADRDLSEPPEEAQEGERYIVAADASGTWAGREGTIALRREGGWRFLTPRIGWRAWVVDEAVLVFWNGDAWEKVTGSDSALQNLVLLGLGTVADSQNPFAAKVNNALWAALGSSEGGNGDLRYTLNKEGSANVLSLLMQSNWSGRAEIGLVGDDDLAIKVSSDGETWKEALRIDRQSAQVSLPGTNLLRDYAVSLLPDSGRFAGNAAKGPSVGAFEFPSYLVLYNGTAVESAGKFITNNTDYGGSAGNLAVVVKDLVDKIRGPGYRRYGVEFHVAQFTMGSGTASAALNIGGTNYYLSLYPTFGPMVPGMTFHAYVRALDAPIAMQRAAGQTFIRDGVRSADHQVIAPGDGWVSMTIHHQVNPYESVGYQPDLFQFRCSASGHRYLLACPAVMGGITDVDDNVGVIASINRWLP